MNGLIKEENKSQDKRIYSSLEEDLMYCFVKRGIKVLTIEVTNSASIYIIKVKRG